MSICSNRIQAPGRCAMFCQGAHTCKHTYRVIQCEKQIGKKQNQTQTPQHLIKWLLDLVTL